MLAFPSVHAGTFVAQGWPRISKSTFGLVGVSKAAEIAYTRILSAEEVAAGTRVMVNAMCPGFCNTALSGHKGPRTAAKGAETAVWLATQPRDSLSSVCAPGLVSGRFFKDLAPVLKFEAEWLA